MTSSWIMAPACTLRHAGERYHKMHTIVTVPTQRDVFTKSRKANENR